MDITKSLLPNPANYGSKRDTWKNEYIVIHYTANDGDTAENNLQYFHNNVVKASAHYFVDEKEICSSVPVNYIAYHCGGSLQGSGGHTFYKKCRNSNSIGIELCSRKDSKGNYYFKEETMLNAAALVRELMKEYNIPIDRVIRHYDVTGKICPAPFISEKAWGNFKSLIKGVEEMEKKYKGVTDIPDWGKDAVKWAMHNSILKGESENNLSLSNSELKCLVWIYRSKDIK